MNRISKKILSLLSRHRRAVWLSSIGSVALFGIFLAVSPVSAFSVGEMMLDGFGTICQVIVWFLGQVTLMMVDVLIDVAQYNSFISEPAVGNGWVIVRDVCNMFFIAILIMMAFGTIVPGLGNFNIKGSNLTKLLITAVLINFSRTFCGLFIDLSQVIMLTFVSGFKEAAGGNFVEALGMTAILQENTGSTGGINTMATIVAYLLAIFMVAISLFTVTVIAVSLVVRIIYLWMLVILSPLAFFSRAIPAGFAGGMYSKWWRMFIQFLVGGPLQAFFLWLALVSVQTGGFAVSGGTAGVGAETVGEGITMAFRNANLQKFVVAVCLLLIGNTLAKEIAGEATSHGFAAAKWAKGKVKRVAAGSARLAGRGLAAIPVGAKDEVSGRRVTLGAMAEGSMDRLKQMKPIAYFSKESGDLRKKQRKADYLRSIGKEDEANRIQSELNETGAVRKMKQMDGVELRKLAADPKANQLDRSQALLALAKKGDSSLKGKGEAAISDMVMQASGNKSNKVLQDAIIKELKSKGDIWADVKDGDISGMEAKDQIKFIQKGSMRLDESGKIANPGLQNVMSGMTQDTFAKLPPSVQDRLQEHYVEGAASLKSLGKDNEAKSLVMKLDELVDDRISKVKPKDYDSMSPAKRDELIKALQQAAAAQKAIGNDGDSERWQDRQFEVTGKDGLMKGMAAASESGDQDRFDRLYGKYADSYGQKMMEMKPQQFKMMSSEKQEDTKKEMRVMTAMMDKMGQKDRAKEIGDKFEGLTGSPILTTGADLDIKSLADSAAKSKDAGSAAIDRMIENIGAKVGVKRMEAMERGEVSRNDLDRAIADSVGGFGKAGEGFRNGALDAQELAESIRSGANLNDYSDKIDSIAKTLKDAIEESRNGRSPLLNEGGKTMNADEVLSASDLGKAIAAAQKASGPKAQADSLSQLSRLIIGYQQRSSHSDRKTSNVIRNDSKVGFSSSITAFRQAIGRQDQKGRVQDTKNAAKQALGTINILFSDSRGAAMTDETRNLVRNLNQALSEVSKAKDVDQNMSNKVNTIISDLDKLSKNI